MSTLYFYTAFTTKVVGFLCLGAILALAGISMVILIVHYFSASFH